MMPAPTRVDIVSDLTAPVPGLAGDGSTEEVPNRHFGRSFEGVRG